MPSPPPPDLPGRRWPANLAALVAVGLLWVAVELALYLTSPALEGGVQSAAQARQEEVALVVALLVDGGLAMLQVRVLKASLWTLLVTGLLGVWLVSELLGARTLASSEALALVVVLALGLVARWAATSSSGNVGSRPPRR